MLQPCFRSTDGTIYVSKYPDGRTAPVHLINSSVPENTVTEDGYLFCGQFFNREHAPDAYKIVFEGF